MNIGFVLKLKSNIFGKVINKNNIIFKTIMRDNRKSPHIREDNFDWLGEKQVKK